MINQKLKKPIEKVGFFIFCILIFGCATYQGKVSDSLRFIQNGQFDKANSKLEALANTVDGDQLVYLLDYGTSLQLSKKLKESNSIYIKADKLADSLDYHSASRIAGSLALSEEMIQYKGDTFEKIFINAMLALNFLELNQLDEALVEARRMNEKYIKIRQQEEKLHQLQQNVFGKYLSAMIWEADGKYDDAFIAYAEAEKIDASIPSLPSDLIRVAKKSRRMDSYQNYKKKYPEVEENPKWYDKNSGELVVIYQQGWGPKKEFNPEDYRFPKLVPTYSKTQKVQLTLNTQNTYISQPLYNVEKAAIQTLRDDYAYIIAKRMGSFVTKKVLADQVRQKNETLGLLTDIVLQVSDRADLRQWSTLPQTIQIIRVPLSSGQYQISLQGLDSFSNVTEENVTDRPVVIKPGKISFVTWRSLK